MVLRALAVPLRIAATIVRLLPIQIRVISIRTGSVTYATPARMRTATDMATKLSTVLDARTQSRIVMIQIHSSCASKQMGRLALQMAIA